MMARFSSFCELARGALYGVAIGGLLLLGCARSPSPATAIQWNLSPEAELFYATLLLDQSIRHDDGAGVLEAVEIFSRREPLPQAFIDAAAWLMLSRQQIRAREVLEKGVGFNPDSLELHLLLAEICLEQGEPDKAAGVLQTFQKAHPESDLARQEVGIMFVKTGRHTEADRLFSALPRRLRTPFARYCHAQALSALGRPDQAMRELRRAVSESPEFTDAWVELARLLEAQGRPAEAAGTYVRALEQDPGNQELRLRLVDMELRANRPDRAMKHTQEGPENFGFQLGAAALFLDAGRFGEAERLLEPLSVQPGAPEEMYFYLAALAYEAHRDRNAALYYLRQVSPANRFHDRAVRLRAQLLYDEGRTEEALTVIREGQKNFPDDRELRLMEAHLLLASERRTEALNVTGNALKDWPTDRDLLFLHGSILDLLDRKEEALTAMEKLLLTFPDDYQALNYVGYTLADNNKDLNRALALLEKAVRLAPDQAYILDSLAWAQFRSNMLREALATIRRAVRLPGSEEWAIWDHYGDIAAALGRKEEARRAWSRALSLQPDDPQSIRAKLKQH